MQPYEKTGLNKKLRFKIRPAGQNPQETAGSSGDVSVGTTVPKVSGSDEFHISSSMLRSPRGPRPSSDFGGQTLQHITLPVFHDDGRLRTQEVLEVEPVATYQYRLLHSPAYVEGIAGGDVIELDQSERLGFRLISRAGNLAVVVVFKKPEDKAAHGKHLEESIQTIGGVVDGGPARVLVITVPFSSGFPAVENVLGAFVEEVPGASWWYGNVYESGDPSRPLNWWKDA